MDSVDRWIGGSTLWMPGCGAGLIDALERAHAAGLRAIEIVPSEWDGPSGFPLTRFGAGFDMDTADAATLDRIGQACSRFDVVTVHSLARDLNLAAFNPGIRRESVRQNVKCIEIARAIGAGWVTFHPGHYTKGLIDPEVLRERNIAFGRQAAELAEKYDMVMGFEEMGFSTGNHFEDLVEVIDRIDSPRFGLNFDIGHAWMLSGPHPYDWLDAFRGRIVEVHLHGAFHRPDRGLETHMPLDFEDCYEYDELFARLADGGFRGPMIFEIISRNLDQYLDRCRQGKQIVMGAWPAGR